MQQEARKFVEYEWRAYSREWEINSKHFESAGYYKWMADKLDLKSGTILEIGCGKRPKADTRLLCFSSPFI